MEGTASRSQALLAGPSSSVEPLGGSPWLPPSGPRDLCRTAVCLITSPWRHLGPGTEPEPDRAGASDLGSRLLGLTPAVLGSDHQ